MQLAKLMADVTGTTGLGGEGSGDHVRGSAGREEKVASTTFRLPHCTE